MKKLGIIFNDNDFSVTLRNFLMLFGENYWNKGGMFTKEDISKLFNHCAGSIYWISQNGREYDHNDNRINYQLPKYDHLQIKEKDVCIDNEVDEFIKENNGWYNSEFHFIEFYLDDKNHKKYIIDSI